MLFKRIVDWMSYNHEFNSSGNKNNSNKTEETYAMKNNPKNIWSEDHHTSRETSMLDLFLAPEVNVNENYSFNEEESRPPICQDKKCLISDTRSAFEPVIKLKDPECSERINISKNSTFHKHRLIPDSTSKEGKVNDDITRSESDSGPKLGTSQKCLISDPRNAVDPVKKLKDVEYFERMASFKNSTFHKHRIISDSINKENKASGDFISFENYSGPKLGISQNSVCKNGVTKTCNVAFHQNSLESKHHPSSEIKNTRSIFTQTKAKRDESGCSSMTETCYKSSQPPIAPAEKNKAFCVDRVAKNNSSFFSRSTECTNYKFESVIYGTLFVFGCNRTIPQHLIGTMDTKFVLHKRLRANGLMKAFSYTRPSNEPISISPAKHFISYPLSSNQSVVVAFKYDKITDMFQIGRYEEPSIDFRVSDVNQLDEARNGVSRYACRILVHRETHEARVYAAAFDSSKAIFLGEAGITSNRNGEMDGFTTNGVLIMHPHRKWREVSVCGYIYPLRSPKVEATMRPRLIEETNVLKDGTLIDLCGITLLWRTPEGLKNTPDEDYLSRLQSSLYKSVPDCQLLLPNANLPFSVMKFQTKKAYVYLSCGHVIGLKISGNPDNLKGWACPVCGAISPIVELTIGLEPGFYLDREFPSHAFRPCGHAASFKTIQYWSSITVPNHRDIQSSRCPFCGVKLHSIFKFIKLTLPE